MTEISRYQYTGVYNQNSSAESYCHPLSMYGHYFSAAYFTTVHHHVVQPLTPYPHLNQCSGFRSLEKVTDPSYQRSIPDPSRPNRLSIDRSLHERELGPAGKSSECALINISPITQLCLPTIQISNNVAENVMTEETDLGYSSWSDITPLDSMATLDDFDLSTGSDDVFDDVRSNFSDIIDEVIGDVAETTGELNYEHAREDTTETQTESNSCSQKFVTGPGNVSVTSQRVFSNSTIRETPMDLPTQQFLRRVQERKQATKQSLTCALCSKVFTNKTNLQVHLRMHNNIRPHQCPHCEKSFTQKSTMRTHIRTHTGEKPYVCSHCARAFSDYSTYRKHQRVHTGEKPYTCDICFKAFAQSGNMIRHKQTHIKNNEAIIV